MPELPEVEATRLSFVQRITGARIVQMRLGKPLRWPLGIAPQDLQGRHVLGVRRRGKYLLMDLDVGLLLLHLGMSGRLSFVPTLPEVGPHDHMDLVTTQGGLRLRDPRRFGAVVWVPSQDAPQARKLLDHLGVEPLSDDFEAVGFHAALRRRTATIKQVLLAGDIVVGVGNIYASEALFLAGIRPTCMACDISLPRVTRLHAAIVDVLSRALNLGGSTLRDFLSAEGQKGYFQLEAAVYGRAGLPCRVCAAPIRSIVQGQRKTFYCPTCQKN